MQPSDSPTSGQPPNRNNPSSTSPHPNCTPQQLAAIEKYKQENPGIDPTPVVNLVMKLRENPKAEQALTQAIEASQRQNAQM